MLSLMLGAAFAMSACGWAPPAGRILDGRALLDAETFWDNKDWDWYIANIPFLDCPDEGIKTTYYYRWELLTKHLTYGSPNSGYSFTEFIDRPFWSGAYGAISCPAGHQLYEARWLREPRYARDYARYWFRTPGAQPRNYSTWIADALWAVHRVHPDDAFARGLLPDLVANHEGWEKRHFSPEVGLFWQTGHDDGMEFNINSRQTRDILRGAPGFRPTLNAYMYADALAIARVADLAGQAPLASRFRDKASALRRNLQAKLWDPRRQFFFHMAQRDEEADGARVKALSLTHQTGRNAGDEHGRELIGYVPWQFSMPDPGHEAAWKKLVDPEGFKAPFGPTTVERNDPMFLLKKTCCWWSGQSWPYATSQTLKAMANLLQEYDQKIVTREDYADLLAAFALTHRKNGKPYLAEACHPETGSFEGHDGYNHSEHYFHSSFNDLVITGLAGLRPRDDDTLEVRPLAPGRWSHFAVDAIPYKGRTVAIVWDADGTRYKKGAGLRLFADGVEIASAAALGPLTGKLPPPRSPSVPAPDRVNFAVNNDGTYFPRVHASHSRPGAPPAKMVDGNYWYHRDPPNRWTSEGSASDSDFVVIDFGTPRGIDTVKLYFLDDGKGIVPPASWELETWDGAGWKPVPGPSRVPEKPEGRRANTISFGPVETSKIRALFRHAPGGRTGLTEFEAWGNARLPLPEPPHPPGNIAHNPGGKPFPRATASHADRFGGKPMSAIDGRTNFLPSPTNRWTSYESPNASDWLEVDFGQKREFNRVEIGIYDDRGGVQPPTRYDVEYWDGNGWKPVANPRLAPEKPVGGLFNEARFDRVSSEKLRIVFTHAGKARSGATEVLVWND